MNGLTHFVLRAVIAALGLWLAERWVDGIDVDAASTLLLAGFLLGIVNALVRPLLLLLTLPVTVLTLGLFLLVVNAAMLGLVAAMLDGMTIASFWSAFWGALVVSFTSAIGSLFFGPSGRYHISVKRRD
jgi:putative membrane protein